MLTENQIRKRVHDFIIIANVVKRIEEIEDAWKFIKLLFLFEYNAYKKNIYGFSGNFFKFKYGAYSSYLATQRENLIFSGFFEETKGSYIKLSDIGLNFTNEINEIVSFNSNFEIDIIDDISKKFGRKTGKELVDYHYDISIKGKNIRAFAKHEVILDENDFTNTICFIDKYPIDGVVDIFRRFVFPKTFGIEHQLEIIDHL